MNIWQRIAAVAKDVTYIQKDAAVQGYKAVSHDQVTGKLRGAMLKHGVGMSASVVGEARIVHVGETAKGAPIIRFEARHVVTFVNVDEPKDWITVEVEAHANDHGDKAPGKALSYACKMAMLKLFLLETGENDEARYQDEELRRELQRAPKPDLGEQFSRWYDENAAKVPDEYLSAVIANWDSIQRIKDCIYTQDLPTASEAWFELSNDEKRAIWRAPTKGGCFTIAEREMIHSDEFRKAHPEYSAEVAGDA